MGAQQHFAYSNYSSDFNCDCTCCWCAADAQLYFLHNFIPFVGFGFCDNFVAYLASRYSRCFQPQKHLQKSASGHCVIFVSYLCHAILCHDWDHDPSWCNPQKNETRGIKRPNLHSKVTTEETGWWWSVPFGCGEGSWMWHIDSTSTLQSGFNTRSPALCDRICTIFQGEQPIPPSRWLHRCETGACDGP